MELKGSKTEANLLAAFAGESQAGLRYQFIAQLAMKQGYKTLSDEIKYIARNETAHAKIIFDTIIEKNGNTENIDISECVKTIAATLPICQVRGLAYSTFTILKILPTQEAEIFQYDNPDVIFMRDGKNVELPYVSMNIDGNEITHTKVKLLENDTFILMSDGVIHAGVQAG